MEVRRKADGITALLRCVHKAFFSQFMHKKKPSCGNLKYKLIQEAGLK